MAESLIYSEPTEYSNTFTFQGYYPFADDAYYDSGDTYDDETGYDTDALAWYFTPPLVKIDPPILPDTLPSPARSLFRHYELRYAGVNVFILSDGTVAQTYATAENSNTNIPYPWDPYNIPPTPYARVYDFHSVETDYTIEPYIVQVFYGGHNRYQITEDVADILLDHGYADCITNT